MKKFHFETEAIRNSIHETSFKEHSIPLFLTSSFTFEDAEEMRAAFADEKEQQIYSRFSNPNTDELNKKMASLEMTEAAFSTSSGMSAIFASIMAFVKPGDEIISCRSIFGATHTLFSKYFSKWDINVKYGDVKDTSSWKNLISNKTRILYIETPTNPALDIIDLEWAGKFAREHKLLFIVDNCFATPYLQQPVKFGADLIIHSGTKYIDGQGRVVGGIVCGKKELIKEVYSFCRSTGPALSPFNAWTLSKSLETLAVRMDRHCSNAHKFAEWVSKHPLVKNVKYPFLESHPDFHIAKKQMMSGGALVTFELTGNSNKGVTFLNSLQMCSLTANLGDTRTIVSHPASTTHAKLSEEERAASGITNGMIRVSLGLEHIDDIIADIEQAIKN